MANLNAALSKFPELAETPVVGLQFQLGTEAIPTEIATAVRYVRGQFLEDELPFSAHTHHEVTFGPAMGMDEKYMATHVEGCKDECKECVSRGGRGYIITLYQTVETHFHGTYMDCNGILEQRIPPSPPRNWRQG